MTQQKIFKVLDTTNQLVENPDTFSGFEDEFLQAGTVKEHLPGMKFTQERDYKGELCDVVKGYDKRNFFNNRNYHIGNINVRIYKESELEPNSADLVLTVSNSMGKALGRKLGGTKTYVVKYGYGLANLTDGDKPLEESGFSLGAPHQNNNALRRMFTDESILNALIDGNLEKIVTEIKRINDLEIEFDRIYISPYLKNVCGCRKS